MHESLPEIKLQHLPRVSRSFRTRMIECSQKESTTKRSFNIFYYHFLLFLKRTATWPECAFWTPLTITGAPENRPEISPEITNTGLQKRKNGRLRPCRFEIEPAICDGFRDEYLINC